MKKQCPVILTPAERDELLIMIGAGSTTAATRGSATAAARPRSAGTPGTATAAVRLLLDYDLAVAMVIHAMDDADVRTILQQPWRMGGTDALLGGKPHPSAYGSYPRILGHYVRDERVLSLEEAIRQMTSAAAARLSLPDRGVIAVGIKADLCLFDAERIADRATFGDFTRLPDGITWVIVNGAPVLHDRVPTGALPGMLLRQR